MIERTPVRVLVAEDDFLVADEIGRCLRSVGFSQIGDASDGAEAVELTRRLAPDVVLMDLHMPGMDGLAACEAIQVQCPTPVVVLTAHESLDLVERARDAGVAAYLTKPPNARQIERAVTIAIARFADLREMRRLTSELEEQNAQLKQALTRIESLEGFLPICSGCKKIRDSAGEWEEVDQYLQTHTKAEMTHGLCPGCAERIYGKAYLARD